MSDLGELNFEEKLWEFACIKKEAGGETERLLHKNFASSRLCVPNKESEKEQKYITP